MPFSDKFRSQPDQYDSVYQVWKGAPTPENTSKLLQNLDPLINKAIQAHVGSANPNLRSRARRMTIDAVKTYDPTRAKLSTHVMTQLQGLKRYARQQTAGISIPERVQLDRQYLDQQEEELRTELGRDPNVDELADRAKISAKRINYVRSTGRAVAEGQFVGPEGPFQPAVEQPSTGAWQEFVYSDLDPTNKKIMEWAVGMHGQPQLSNLEIARRLRLTPGAISQRKRNIQQILDQEQDLSPFMG